MPVSLLPLIATALLVLTPFFLLFKSRRAAMVGASVSFALVGALFGFVYFTGWRLYVQATGGNAAAQYQYAQWLETHAESLNQFVLWPASPDVLGGYYWLERAAEQNYAPAVYLVGVRLKEGIGVPKPPHWDGPAGNWFPQPARGQALIDRAVGPLGYVPPHPREVEFYMVHYRRGLPP